MTSLSSVRVHLWCQSLFTLLFSWRFASSGPAAGIKKPNTNHDSGPNNAGTVGGPFCGRLGPEPLEHSQTAGALVAPGHEASVDVPRTGSLSTPPRSISGMAQICTTEMHIGGPKPRLFSKIFTILHRRAPPVDVSTIGSQLNPSSNPNRRIGVLKMGWSRMDTLPDLTGQLSRTSEYATSFGGLSDIWRCVLKTNGGIVVVAVKSIRSQVVDEEEAKNKTRKLSHERKIWSRLRHDNIVPLYGTASSFGPFVALVCPWYENGSLSGYLECLGETLSMVDRFRLLSDVSAGLQYVHSCSIVHGDLTGSNVLISSDGRAHLSDFGLSVIVAEFMVTSYFTPAFSGTVRWMAPELVAVPEEEGTNMIPTTQSDIYSFGCIMFQVFTGKPPYSEHKRDAQVVVAISLGTKPLRPVLPVIIDHHWEFIMICWSTKNCRPSVQQVDTHIKKQLRILQHDSTSSE